MRTRRIHITGASGAGVTSLGRAISAALSIPHHDTDDYYWRPTTPPFTEKREIPERLRLMREVFLDRPAWVLSGSLDGWGDPLIPMFDLVAFVSAPTETRLNRLRNRESQIFGADAVAAGGWRREATEAFIAWASRYEQSDREGRNLARHCAWLTRLPCPVVHIDGVKPIAESAACVAAAIA